MEQGPIEVMSGCLRAVDDGRCVGLRFDVLGITDEDVVRDLSDAISACVKQYVDANLIPGAIPVEIPVTRQ